MNLNFNDFRVCKKCEAINLLSDSSCRICGDTNLVGIRRAAGNSLVTFTVAFAVSIVTFGIATPIVYLYLKSFMKRKNQLIEKYFNKALETFESEASNQVNSAISHYEEGVKHFNLGQFDLARTCFENAKKNGNTSISAVFGQAICCYNLQIYDEAKDLFEELRNSENAPDGINEILAWAYVKSGIESKKQCDFLAEKLPVAGDSLKRLITLAIAKYCYENKIVDLNYKEILVHAINIEPNNPLHVEALGGMLVSNQYLEEVVKHCSNLSKKFQTDVTIELHAKALHKLRDTSPGSIEVYKAYLDLYPQDVDIRIRLTQAYVLNKSFLEAINTYKAGLELDPGNLSLRYQLALTLLAAEQVDNSIAELQTVIKTANYADYVPTAIVCRLLGRCFVKKDMLEIAMKFFFQSDRSKETLEQLYALGQLFNKKGDWNSAKKCWQEVYASDINYKDVATRIS